MRKLWGWARLWKKKEIKAAVLLFTLGAVSQEYYFSIPGREYY